MKKSILILLVLAAMASCKSKKVTPEPLPKIKTLQGSSLLGIPLVSPDLDKVEDSTKILNYHQAEARYEKDPSADNLIWLGRRMGYLGDYAKAITLFSKGVAEFPDDARFYRHRGHRYITLRQYDYALADFDKGITLIQGTDDVIEPDGMPNDANIPVSSLHFNLYYHKGVAHYLKNEMQAAEKAFSHGLALSQNDDMRVAHAHWLFMVYRHLGKQKEAEALLIPFHAKQQIIENKAYHQLLLFYKGEITFSQLDLPDAQEATRYALAYWKQVQGEISLAKERYKNVLAKGHWARFGYMAAEAELSRMVD
jgi:tetratricopeptide (TPR) repeat protein